jgi:hypothetical protein
VPETGSLARHAADVEVQTTVPYTNKAPDRLEDRAVGPAKGLNAWVGTLERGCLAVKSQ